MECQDCGVKGSKHGKDRKGNQRFRCRECGRTFVEPRGQVFGDMRLPLDKAVLCLKLLCEGSSVRSVSRITGVHKNTILKLTRVVGDRLERFMGRMVQDVEVEDVQCDELWGFIGMKERTKAAKGETDAQKGDAYCFIALERHSKLVLAWHLGRRTTQATDAFIEKLDEATDGRFQVTTDGFAAYPDSISYHLGTRTDYATLIKEYGQDPEGQRRYSPAKITGTVRTAVHGSPDRKRVCTSHVERLNLSLRTQLRRLTRLTIAFSKCWRNHRASLAVFFAFYNFVRPHRSLSGVTPAMAAGVPDRLWSWEDMLRAAATHS